MVDSGILEYILIEMRRRKTYKRKRNLKKRRTARHLRRGGMNYSNFNQGNGSFANAHAVHANQNDEFDDRRIELINTLTDIIIRAETTPNIGYVEFMTDIEALRQEALDIDAYFGNDDMEQLINQRIHDIIDIFGLENNANFNMNNNNNNNATVRNNNARSIKSNNNNNNNNNKRNRNMNVK